jgi:signal transduction histidine kinase
MRLVTHELRAPVAAIQSYMQLILEGYVPEARLMEIVGKAESRARDQLDLIGDLLDLARLQDLPPAAGAAECDVVASLEDVLDLVQARLADRSLTVFRDLPDSPVRAPVSEDHMRQVWTNLVSNAIKYTPPGGQIHVRVAVDGSTIRRRRTGYGHRHVTRRDGPHLSDLLPRPGRQRDVATGHRPGPGHREGHRRTLRRPRLGRI